MSATGPFPRRSLPKGREGAPAGPWGTARSAKGAACAALLREQQRAFAAAVVHGADTAGLFTANARGGAPLVEIYRHAYGARLAEALRDNFEILALAMGDEAFTELAAAYIAAQPSRRPSIRWFGDGLAGFMAERVAIDDGLVPHPAFVDFARMDWALRAAFDAADAPALGRDVLATLPPEAFAGLRLRPHPSVQIVQLDWAIEAAWRALRGHDPASGSEPELPAPTPSSHKLLAWRRGLETQWRSLDDTEAALLQAMAAGDDFATLCERAARFCGGDAERAATIAAIALAQWFGDSLIGERLTD